MKTQDKKIQRDRRRKRIRAKISGTAATPRLSIFKSNRYISAQLIDDESGKTLLSGRSQAFKGNKTEQAVALGNDLAVKAKAANIKSVVFDRGAKKYHGRVKALADALRAGGLEF